MESEHSAYGAGRFRMVAIGVGVLALFMLLKTMVVYISPGHVGIVINRTAGGVNPVALNPGLHLRNPLTTGIMEYPTFMQTLVLTRTSNEGERYNEEINVNSVEGQPLSLDISMSFKLDPLKVPFLYTTFRTRRRGDRAQLCEAGGAPGIAGSGGQRAHRGCDRAQEG